MPFWSTRKSLRAFYFKEYGLSFIDFPDKIIKKNAADAQIKSAHLRQNISPTAIAGLSSSNFQILKSLYHFYYHRTCTATAVANSCSAVFSAFLLQHIY